MSTAGKYNFWDFANYWLIRDETGRLVGTSDREPRDGEAEGYQGA